MMSVSLRRINTFSVAKLFELWLARLPHRLTLEIVGLGTQD